MECIGLLSCRFHLFHIGCFGLFFFVKQKTAYEVRISAWSSDVCSSDLYFERQMPSADVLPLFEASAAYGIGFYLGYAELTAEGRHFNTSILVNDKGRIVGKYRKVHLPGHSEHEPQRPWQHLEKRYFEPGDLGFPVWRTMGGIHGMGICNDRRWPEVYRAMSLQGVEVVSIGYNPPDENTAASEPKHLRNFHKTG